MGGLISFATVLFVCTALVGALVPAAAQQPYPMPSASEYSAKLLPARADVVPWKSLSNVRVVKEGDGIALSIGDEILALDQKTLRVQGFMIPLAMGDEQSHFLISAVRSCPFCVPAVAYEIVEVRSSKPTRYGVEPIVVSGRFAVLKHDPSGVIYRMSDAVAVAGQ